MNYIIPFVQLFFSLHLFLDFIFLKNTFNFFLFIQDSLNPIKIDITIIFSLKLIILNFYFSFIIII